MMSPDDIAQRLTQIDSILSPPPELESTLASLASQAEPPQVVVVAKVAISCLRKWGKGKSVVEHCLKLLKSKGSYPDQVACALAESRLPDSDVGWMHDLFVDVIKSDAYYNSLFFNFSNFIVTNLSTESRDYMLAEDRGPGMYNTDTLLWAIKENHPSSEELSDRIVQWIKTLRYGRTAYGAIAPSESLDILILSIDRLCSEVYQSPPIQKIRDAILEVTFKLLQEDGTRGLALHYLGEMLQKAYSDAGRVMEECLLTSSLPTLVRTLISLYAEGWCEFPLRYKEWFWWNDFPESRDKKQYPVGSERDLQKEQAEIDQIMEEWAVRKDLRGDSSIPTSLGGRDFIPSELVGASYADRERIFAAIKRIRPSDAKELNSVLRSRDTYVLASLSSISGVAAFYLAEIFGAEIHLPNLKALSDPAAYYLSRSKGQIILPACVECSEYGRDVLQKSSAAHFGEKRLVLEISKELSHEELQLRIEIFSGPELGKRLEDLGIDTVEKFVAAPLSDLFPKTDPHYRRVARIVGYLNSLH